MTPRIRIALEVVAGLALIGLLGSYILAREDRIRLEATVTAEKQVIDQAAVDRAQHAKDDAARDVATASTIADMAKAVAQLKTPGQITGWSQAQLEQAIKGLQITVPAPTAANPHPDAIVTIPESSLPGLRDTIERCKECDIKLGTAEANLESRLQQMKLADQQIEAIKKERDTAITASKGGTALQRFGRAAKWVIVGGIAGFIAGHKF